MRLLFAELSDIFRVYSLRITVYFFFSGYRVYDLQFIAILLTVYGVRIKIYRLQFTVERVPGGAVNRKL